MVATARVTPDATSVQQDGPPVGILAPAEPAHPQYALRLVQAAGTIRVDHTRTLFSAYLPRHTAEQLQQVVDRVSLMRWLVALYWTSQGIAAALALLDTLDTLDTTTTTTIEPPPPLVWTTVLASTSVVVASPALVLATGSLSLKMVRLLWQEGEFRCAMLLNTLQWLAIALSFQDVRVLVCLVEWWVVLLAFAVDADVQLHERWLWSSIAATIMSTLYLSCSLASAQNGNVHDLFMINGHQTTTNDILQWTSPTLVALLLKSLYHQEIRRRRKNPQRAGDSVDTATATIVYGSLIKMRLTLADAESAATHVAVQVQRPGSPLGTPLVSSSTCVPSIDPCATLISTGAFPLPDPGERGLPLVLLYVCGIVSFAATCHSTIACQLQAGQAGTSATAAHATSVASLALIGTSLFCGATARYYHRQLLLVLLQSFDVFFSMAQFLGGALLLMSMYDWDVRCVNVASWSIWFHWLLLFDALTPPIRQSLRLSKVIMTPVMLFTLYALSGPLVLLYGYTDTHLTDRDLFADLNVSTLLVTRVLTLWLWNVRLVWDFGVRDESELHLVHEMVEFVAPRGQPLPRRSSKRPRDATMAGVVPAGMLGSIMLLRRPLPVSMRRTPSLVSQRLASLSRRSGRERETPSALSPK